MSTPTLQARGSEAIARHLGRCRLCPRPIRPGEALLKLPLGWVHTDCGDRYRAVLAQHLEGAT